MCEDFACTRLKICPRDLKQRIEDGLGAVLSVFGNPCGTFNFKGMLDSTEPTSNLPVLFSSQQFRSPALIDTTIPLFPTQVPPIEIEEYWSGLSPFGENTICARGGLKCYFFYNDRWLLWEVTPGVQSFKSVPGTCLFAALWPTGSKIVLQTDQARELGTLPGVTACQLSGNGQACFARDATGWKRHTGNVTWNLIGKPGSALDLNTSFDGEIFVQSNPSSPEYYYKIGSAELQTKSLAVDESKDDPVLSAVRDNKVFIARGKKVYSVGSLDVEKVIFELIGAVATGMWADEQTLWLTTDKGTFMTNNAGWTWTELRNLFAVGPGLFAKPDNAQIWKNSEQSFVQAVGFPLRLTNGGLLYNDTNKWANAYQDKTMNDEFTTIKATDKTALSPNGLYLLTQENGLVTLYLNVWNSASFAAWCKKDGNNCQAAYARYCQEFKIDPGCKTDTPGGPGNPGTPGPTPPPPDPKKGLPTWAIVLIAIGGLAIIGAILFAVLKKPQSIYVSTPISTPISTLPSSTSDLEF